MLTECMPVQILVCAIHTVTAGQMHSVAHISAPYTNQIYITRTGQQVIAALPASLPAHGHMKQPGTKGFQNSSSSETKHAA